MFILCQPSEGIVIARNMPSPARCSNSKKVPRALLHTTQLRQQKVVVQVNFHIKVRSLTELSTVKYWCLEQIETNKHQIDFLATPAPAGTRPKYVAMKIAPWQRGDKNLMLAFVPVKKENARMRRKQGRMTALDHKLASFEARLQ